MYPISNERNNKANSFEKISSVQAFVIMHVLCNQHDVQYLLLLSLLFLFVVCRCVKVVALPYMKHLKKELKSQCCVREE